MSYLPNRDFMETSNEVSSRVHQIAQYCTVRATYWNIRGRTATWALGLPAFVAILM